MKSKGNNFSLLAKTCPRCLTDDNLQCSEILKPNIAPINIYEMLNAGKVTLGSGKGFQRRAISLIIVLNKV